MSVSVTVAGTSYTIPSVGDVTWGPQVTAWIQAISAVTLQTSGGSFTLTNDLNFGTSFGLISKYFTSVTANPASAGSVRLANLDFIKWRNAGNSADLGVQLDASNILQFSAAINSSSNITGLNLSGTNTGDITLAAVGSSPAAEGASLASQVLTLQPADGTHPGLLTFGAQTIGGAKTFSGGIILGAGLNANSQAITNATIVAGSNSISGLVNANLSGSAAISNANLATMAANTVKANATGSTAVPADLALVSAATASAAMVRDANANIQANNFIENYATTATGGTTTTLTVGSPYTQMFTGSTTQTVVFPDCTTLVLGFQFYIVNRSTGAVAVNKNGGVSVQSMATNTSALFTCTSIGTAAGAWDVQYVAASTLSNPMTTLGDLILGAASGTPARLAVGSNGQRLTADSTATNGQSWGNPANYRNHLVNGAFDYWQVGTTATVTATGGASPSNTYLYQADQWYVNNKLGGGTIEGVITFSQVTGVTNGSMFGASVKITTAPTGTGIQNGCELYQTLSNRASYALYNQTASLTVLVKALGNVNQVGVQFFYKTTEAKVDTAIGSEVLTTVSSGAFTACTINGQALGTSQTVNGVIGVRIRITAVSSGNTYDLNNGFVCEQAIMNLGSVAMPFSRQYEDPVCELAACQFFYEKSYDLTVVPGTNTGTESAGGNQSRCGFLSSALQFTRMNLPFKVSKRVIPTMTGYSTDGTSGKFRDRVNTTNVTPIFLTGINQAVADVTNSSAATSFWFEGHWTADARI